MPFSDGLLFSYGQSFYPLSKDERSRYFPVLQDAYQGNEEPLAEQCKDRVLPQEQSARAWFAVGNCLFGYVLRSSIVISVENNNRLYPLKKV